MASRTTFDVKSHEVSSATIAGSFAVSTSSVVSDIKGKGYTAVKSGTGVITMTFDDKWPDLLSAVATLQLGTASDQFAQIGVYTAADKTLVINIWDVSGAALANPANAGRINFRCTFSNSTA